MEGVVSEPETSSSEEDESDDDDNGSDYGVKEEM